MRHATRALWAAPLLWALPIACSGGSSSGAEPDAVFQFRTSDQLGVSVEVTRDGLPVQGAAVSILETRSLEEIDGADNHGLAWFTGGTDAEGRCESVVAIPTTVARVDVVVHHDGSRGPYSDEALRAHWGPFAPSSRQTVRVADLGNLRVVLEEVR